jgi:hypothetical protein
MVSYRIKDNRQRNLPPKLEVTNEDTVIVRSTNHGYKWLELNIVEPVRDYIMSVKQVYSKIN